MANFVNEDGLYDVILDSRKPSARASASWVTSEVCRKSARRAVTFLLMTRTTTRQFWLRRHEPTVRE